MVLYIIIFGLTAALYSWATHVKSKLKFILLFLVILIPSLFAGVRDSSVGTDLGTYAIRSWKLLSYYSNFSDYYAVEGSEIAYSALNFLVYQFTDDFNVFLFVHQLFLMFFVVFAAWSQRFRYSSVFVVLTYLFFMYNMSLSAMRQSLAVVLVMVASMYLDDVKRRKLFFLICLVAMCFHNSVLFVMVIPLVQYLTEKYPRKRVLIYLASILIAFAISAGFQTILNALLSYGLVSVKYGMYLGQSGFKTHKIALVVEFCLFFFNAFMIRNRNRVFFNKVQYILLISFCIEMMGSIVETATRIVIYLMVVVLMLAPRITDSKSERKKIYCVYVFFMFIHFFYTCMTGSYNNTIPYTSKLIGI